MNKVEVNKQEVVISDQLQPVSPNQLAELYFDEIAPDPPVQNTFPTQDDLHDPWK